ncbi:MAG: type II CAAX endopeptidase family protein [Dehalococcoidales bacterium]|nr:type II CAAX endopeptidase family protein [Dehalococcoidales bacterium]
MIPAVVYFLAITGAETVTTFVSPIWGMVIHIVIFLALLVHSALTSRELYRRLLLPIALVPLVRIISLSMPLAGLPQIWWYPIIYAPLLIAGIAVMKILNQEPKQVGFTMKRVPLQLLIMLTGVPLGIAEYSILTPQAMVNEFTWQGIWLPALVLVICTGFVEEFIFRGVLQHSMVEAFKWRGIVYVSMLFAILHMGYLSWTDGIFVFLVALFFGWIVNKTGSLLGVSLAHGVTNVMLFLVVPFFA